MNPVQSKLLLIYVPTYEGRENLLYFFERYLQEVDGYEEYVDLHINDNASKFEIYKLIPPKRGVRITRNNVNIGLSRNINRVFDFNKSYEYTWILGDDDYLTPGSIARIVKTLRQKNPDYVFLNTITFSLNLKQKIINDFRQNYYLPLMCGSVKSKISTRSLEVPFKRLLNPRVDEVVLGSLMCGLFKTSVVSDHSSRSFPDSLELSVWSAYPHTINYANSISPDSEALYDPFLYTFNFWGGGNTWKKQYDIVVALGLLNSIKHFSENGHLDEESELTLIDHYLHISKTCRKNLHQSGNKEILAQCLEVYPYLISRLSDFRLSRSRNLCSVVATRLRSWAANFSLRL